MGRYPVRRLEQICSIIAALSDSPSLSLMSCAIWNVGWGTVVNVQFNFGECRSLMFTVVVLIVTLNT